MKVTVEIESIELVKGHKEDGLSKVDGLPHLHIKIGDFDLTLYPIEINDKYDDILILETFIKDYEDFLKEAREEGERYG